MKILKFDEFEPILEARRLTSDDYRLFNACRNNDIKIVKELVGSGKCANLEIREYDTTPLMAACHNSSLSVIKYLISQGADINVKDSYNRTPMMLVNSSFSGIDKELRTMKFLISQGADVNSVDKGGSNCFSYASDIWKKYDLQKALIEQDTQNIHLLTKNNIPIHPKIKEEYPEDNISDELGFFN